jgi:predicted transposase/invertase (TIGR01784 family)
MSRLSPQRFSGTGSGGGVESSAGDSALQPVKRNNEERRANNDRCIAPGYIHWAFGSRLGSTQLVRLPRCATLRDFALASSRVRWQNPGMVFADLKNDYVFRRIFATHPDLLCGLLNDLLERSGDQTIDQIQYLPSEQLPVVEGAKLSVLDVRCTDRRGTKFVVEMQLIHHPGFVNRVVYNACRAYSAQLRAGDWYTKLNDVVAISICDFELWPDAKQREHNLPLVPMLSRWNMVERNSKTDGLLQVQYAFLELPKVSKQRPTSAGAALWAWLFVHAPDLTDVPEDLVPGPYRAALELANQAKFSQLQVEAYEKVRDEIRQVIEIAAARYAEGEAKGKLEGKLETFFRLLTRAKISLSDDDQARIKACNDASMLDRWIENVIGATNAADVLG